MLIFIFSAKQILQEIVFTLLMILIQLAKVAQNYMEWRYAGSGGVKARYKIYFVQSIPNFSFSWFSGGVSHV